MQSVFQRQFAGIRPAIDDKNIDGRYALRAHNTRLRDTTLRPFRAPKAVGVEGDITGGAVTLLRLSDTQSCCGPLQGWNECVFPLTNFPAPNTCHEFDQLVLFYSGCKEPQRYLLCSREYAPLVVYGPKAAVNLVRVATGTLQNHPYAGPDARSYTYTWVDKFGVESTPAMPSVVVKSYDDETWRLSGFDVPPGNAVAVRIYRSTSPMETGEQIPIAANTSYQLVDEVSLPLAGNAYDDNRKLLDLAYGTLETDENCDPPCMDQVMSTQSGYAVGFKGNDLYFSERYEPHNWPTRYRTTLPDRIVALATTGDFVFVGTTGVPYRIMTSPSVPANQNAQVDLTIDPLPYDEHYPCFGRFTMVSTNFGAMYSTERGLVALQPKGAAMLVSRSRVDEDWWYRDFAPNLAAWHDGKYFAVRAPSAKGFVFDIKDGAEGEVDIGDLVTVDLPATAIHSGRDGHLYYANATGVYQWNAGPDLMTYEYGSKVFRMPGLVGMSAAKVVADYGPPLRFEIYTVDGDSYRRVYDGQVGSTKPFRLPMFGRAIEYQFRLTGTTRVREVHIATSINDLVQEPR